MNTLPDADKQALGVLLMDYAAFGIADLVQDGPALWLKDPVETQKAVAAPLASAPRTAPSVAVSNSPASRLSERLKESPTPDKKADAAPVKVAQTPEKITVTVENESADILFLMIGKKDSLSAPEINLMQKIAMTLSPEASTGFVCVSAAKYPEAQAKELTPILTNLGAKHLCVWGQEAVNALHGKDILLRQASGVRDVAGKTCLYFYHPRTILRQGNLKKLAWHEVLSVQG